MTTALDILIEARRLLSDKSRWTRHVYGRDDTGKSQSVTSNDACSFCALGAVIKSGNTLLGTNFLGVGQVLEGSPPIAAALTLLRDALPSGYDADDSYFNVAALNDYESHAEVLALFNRAIERAKDGTLSISS